MAEWKSRGALGGDHRCREEQGQLSSSSDSLKAAMARLRPPLPRHSTRCSMNGWSCTAHSDDAILRREQSWRSLRR